MERINNPFAPGAGAPPPELAGREDIRETIQVAVERIRRGRSAKGLILIGLRGVGKTVLLDQISRDVESDNVLCLHIEAPENRSLPALLAPKLRQALLTLSKRERSRDFAKRGLRALAGFATSLKVKFGDIEVGLDYDPEAGLADNGNLDDDLLALVRAVGEAGRAADTAIVLFIDELQYVAIPELSALIMALHGVRRYELPFTMIGAGLPQLRGRLGNAKSYAERLFEFPPIGALTDHAAEEALEKPLREEGVDIEADAIASLIKKTERYPYFLQEWGKQTWDIASTSPIAVADVEAASDLALAALDDSFFGVRLDRLTPTERRYLRTMAELGPGPHRSGDIAGMLQRDVQSLGPIRARLLEKGMIWSPSHGDTASFTVPLFDAFMRRTMPLESD